MLKTICFLIFSILFFPTEAYAYLDPGSGSALFASMIALVLAGIYTIKTLYYKILKKDVSLAEGSYEDTLLIMSEGKTYWGTFRPLVDELIKREIHFRYASLDVDDPGLTIRNEYMHSKRYGKNTGGFGKLAAIKAPVMLVLTPNIGSDGHPLPRSPKVKQLVYIFNSFAEDTFQLGGLDFYDSVIMVGEYQEKTLRVVEKARNRPPKEMVALGLPYFDDLYQRLSSQNTAQLPNDFAGKTVLVAPSWGSKGCLSEYGTDFLKILVEGGFRVIVRLHPQSHIAEPDQVSRWKEETRNFVNFSWDDEVYSTQSMDAADILISDTSGVRFDFALLHLKPVITLNIPKQNYLGFEAHYQEEGIWADAIAPKIGAVLTKADIEKLPEVVSELINKFDTENLISLRNQLVTNFGHSAEVIVPFLQAKVATVLLEETGNSHLK